MAGIPANDVQPECDRGMPQPVRCQMQTQMAAILGDQMMQAVYSQALPLLSGR